ncbi:MAG: hypothetical protein M0Z28_31735 [Rhodospirillales bacterium]|nr:hypothetical protein [Rhodospirillales bacterium]
MAYSFSFADEPSVEIPELDAFMADLKAACEKHGVGFVLEWDNDDIKILNIVPVAAGDWAMFTDYLTYYEGGVPFLDAAKARWRTLVAERDRARREQAAQQSRAEIARQETALKAQGITLSDGHYRLVKDA